MPRKPATTPIPSLTADERETVILMDDATNVARISTHQRTIYTKLKNNPAATLVEDLTLGSSIGGTFELPAEFISFRSRKKSRVLTDEQKKQQKVYAAKAAKARRGA